MLFTVLIEREVQVDVQRLTKDIQLRKHHAALLEAFDAEGCPRFDLAIGKKLILDGVIIALKLIVCLDQT